MDDKEAWTPTPATPEGNAVQDRVEAPGVKAPGVKPPARPKGPNASAIVVGLVAIILGGLIIAKETMNLRIDWSRLGPGAIVGIGMVMAVVGAIGLLRRRDDS